VTSKANVLKLTQIGKNNLQNLCEEES